MTELERRAAEFVRETPVTLLSTTDVWQAGYRAALADAAKVANEAAETKYLQGCQLAKADGCLGEDFKLDAGRFGKAELQDHREMAKAFGGHKTAADIADAIRKLGDA